MKKSQIHGRIKLEGKRHQELWIYSFADMYMILTVFFIALSVIYAAKAREVKEERPTHVPSAGRGPASVESSMEVSFGTGSASLDEDAIESLELLLPVVKASQAPIDVEGYSDGRSLSKDSRFSSNLSLSNTRAVRVAEWLIANGVSSRRVRTFSYGDSYLYRSGSGGVVTNRRVVIKLMANAGGS